MKKLFALMLVSLFVLGVLAQVSQAIILDPRYGEREAHPNIYVENKEFSDRDLEAPKREGKKGGVLQTVPNKANQIIKKMTHKLVQS